MKDRKATSNLVTKFRCPYCGTDMLPVFVMMSGGTWLSLEREWKATRLCRTGTLAYMV